MAEYKLYYFNAKARAETIRMLFALADQPFQDVRLTLEEWPKFKETMPFGKVPLLEIDGERWIQSQVIGRMLARRFGFAGKTPKEQARADMIVDCVEELYPKHRPTFPFNADKDNEEVRLAKLKVYEEETLPLYLHRLETLLKENKGGDGWFIGDGITWTDLAVLNLLVYCIHPSVKPDLDNVPKLNALFNRIETHPKIAAWIKKRPKDELC